MRRIFHVTLKRFDGGRWVTRHEYIGAPSQGIAIQEAFLGPLLRETPQSAITGIMVKTDWTLTFLSWINRTLGCVRNKKG